MGTAMDLVKRLREGAGHLPDDIMDAESAMERAADEIERMRAERDEWEARCRRLLALEQMIERAAPADADEQNGDGK